MDLLPYKKSFFCALALHALLILMLCTDSTKKPALTKESQHTPGQETAIIARPQPEPIKAVSLNSQEVMATIQRLKQERAQQQQNQLNQQNELKRQAQRATQQRIKEQQRLALLKEEAEKIAIARKEEEKRHQKELKELAQQKALETQKIEELKKQQQLKALEEKKLETKKLEAKKLAELQEKKLQAEKLKEEQARANKSRADKEAALQANAAAAKQQALQEAQNQARLAGEVDKYRALILNAISRNWIRPEHVDSNLSSLFRIRLAPDGMVLAVSLIRSSGDPLLDRSAQTAIYKASPLPVPTQAEAFSLFRDINLTVRPEQIRE